MRYINVVFEESHEFSTIKERLERYIRKALALSA